MRASNSVPANSLLADENADFSESAARATKHPLGDLFAPLDFLLASGGDTRLKLDAVDRLNGYGCRPFPRPEALTFASSTATSISTRAYERVYRARQNLIEATLAIGLDAAFETRIEAMRAELKTHLNIATNAEIVFSPSGTDSQMHALFVAQSLFKRPIASIIAAADETGSGTAFSATGRHFNTCTAQAVGVGKAEPVDGLAHNTTAVEIRLRDKKGNLRSAVAIDDMFMAAVAAAIDSDRSVLLHVMDRSKLGWRSPSDQCVRDICRRWPTQVQVVVDACQGRLGRKRINAYLSRGYMVLLTGSKFFTGAPFSGALLVPEGLSRLMTAVDSMPRGLCDYTNRNDWPKAWQGIRARLSPRINFGQWLRWESALEEMRAFYAVPQDFRASALRSFGSQVEDLIEASPSLLLLPDQPHDVSDSIDDEEMAARTIWPFLLRLNGKPLSLATCAKLYRALNRDVSDALPTSAAVEEKRLASVLCHIGQPVALIYDGVPTAALRISAGARVVSESWSAKPATANANLDHEIAEVATILEKIELLLTYRDAMGFVEEPPTPSFYADAANRMQKRA